MKRRKRIPASVVRELWTWQRGRCNGAACGQPLVPLGFDVDHVVPLHLGGTDELLDPATAEQQLQLLCAVCHAIKSRTEMREWHRRSPYFRQRSFVPLRTPIPHHFLAKVALAGIVRAEAQIEAPTPQSCYRHAPPREPLRVVETPKTEPTP